MDFPLPLIHAAVLVAALIHGAMGIGFGLLSGPVLLMAFNSHAGIQVAILLSWLVSLCLARSVYKSVDFGLIRRILLGMVIGAGPGVWLHLQADIAALKLAAGLVVAFMIYLAVRREPTGPIRKETLQRDIAVGSLAGAMSAALAIPGPPVAAELIARRVPKQELRATLITLWAVSQPIAIGAQAAAAGISISTLKFAATLVPAVVIGLLLGRYSANFISESIFQRALIALLACSSANLLFDSVRRMLM